MYLSAEKNSGYRHLFLYITHIIAVFVDILCWEIMAFGPIQIRILHGQGQKSVFFFCHKQHWDGNTSRRLILYEPRHEKNRIFAYAKTKVQISFAVTPKLISAFVFASRIVQSLYFLNPKFQASSHLLWLYSLVCVGPGRKPQRPIFSRHGLHRLMVLSYTVKPVLSDHIFGFSDR